MRKFILVLAALLPVLISAPAGAWGVKEAMRRCHGHHACGLGAPMCSSGVLGFVTIYGNRDGIYRGKKTASGQGFEPGALRAASMRAPLGSTVTVVNPMNGTSVSVTVNDRGPALAALDLTPAAARALGMNGSSKYMCISGPGYGHGATAVAALARAPKVQAKKGHAAGEERVSTASNDHYALLAFEQRGAPN